MGPSAIFGSVGRCGQQREAGQFPGGGNGSRLGLDFGLHRLCSDEMVVYSSGLVVCDQNSLSNQKLITNPLRRFPPLAVASRYDFALL